MSLEADGMVYDMSIETEDVKIPFLKKSVPYVGDTNTNANYSTNEIIFDALNFTNSGQWADMRNGYIMIPLVITLTSNDDSVDFSAGAPTHTDFAIGLKNSNLNLINSMIFEYGTSTLVHSNPNLNQYLIFKQHTTMSEIDEMLNGPLINYALDAPTSWQYNDTAGLQGSGICNNVTGIGRYVYNSANGGQIFNDGLARRQQMFFRSTQTAPFGGRDKIFGTDDSVFKEKNVNYIVNRGSSAATKLKTYYYNAILRLKDLHPVFETMPLIRGARTKLTLKINQCYFEVTKDASGNLSYNASNTQAPNGTVPLMFSASGATITEINSLSGPTTINNSYLSGASGLTAKTYQCSLSVVKNIWSGQKNYSDGSQTHKLTQCRLYVPMYILQTKYEAEYMGLGQQMIKYTDVISKTIEGVVQNQEVQFNVTSSIVNPKRLIIVPILSGSASGNGPAGATFSPLVSPFATEPSTCSPYAITNLQVQLSSVPVYSQQQNYTYESFLYEMNNFGIDSNLKSGVVTSRISLMHYMNNYGYIVVNLSRKAPEEELNPVSIDVQFKQMSLLKMNYYVFVESEKSWTVNLLNGSRL
jgi:hypothetical protein